jgi:hypothetical protein
MKFLIVVSQFSAHRISNDARMESPVRTSHKPLWGLRKLTR